MGELFMVLYYVIHQGPVLIDAYAREDRAKARLKAELVGESDWVLAPDGMSAEILDDSGQSPGWLKRIAVERREVK